MRMFCAKNKIQKQINFRIASCSHAGPAHQFELITMKKAANIGINKKNTKCVKSLHIPTNRMYICAGGKKMFVYALSEACFCDSS